MNVVGHWWFMFIWWHQFFLNILKKKIPPTTSTCSSLLDGDGGRQNWHCNLKCRNLDSYSANKCLWQVLLLSNRILRWSVNNTWTLIFTQAFWKARLFGKGPLPSLWRYLFFGYSELGCLAICQISIAPMTRLLMPRFIATHVCCCEGRYSFSFSLSLSSPCVSGIETCSVPPNQN